MPRLKIKFLGGSVMMLVLFFCSAPIFWEDNKQLKTEMSPLEQQLTKTTSSSSMRKHSVVEKTAEPPPSRIDTKLLNCPAELQESGDIEPKEFFVFHNNIVWCNVFKSASTSVLYIMGLLEGYSVHQLKKMSRHPLVSEMRSIYGRPTLQSLKLKLEDPGTKVFIVKRHPFQRLFSGFKDKIIGAIKGSYHDKMAQKILENTRGLPKNEYKFKETVPTFAEFVEFVLDEYDRNGDVDMHWAPVVDFCSVCQVNYTHVLDFEHLHEDMSAMLPEKQELFAQLKVNAVRLNVNKKHPVTQDFIRDNLVSLGTTLYQRLCHFYAKDFQVFGYSYPDITFDT